MLAKGNHKRVSDIIGNDYKQWENEFVILDCGTGCGKTYFCLHVLAEYAKQNNKKVLYLCNRHKLRDQVFNETKQLNLLRTVRVTSYQKLQQDIREAKEIPYYDYIIADECHYFITDAIFNDSTDISYNYVMKQKQSVVLLVSATAKSFFTRLLHDKRVKKRNSYLLDKDYSYVNKLYFYQKDELTSIIDDILENEADSKIVVFCNSGDRVLEMHTTYKNSASYYCAKSAKSRKLKQICGWLDENGKEQDANCINRISETLITFDKRLLFTTTVLDNGIDLKDLRIKHVFSEIVDIDILIQSLGRKRNISDNDFCTFYIREYQAKGIQGFINKAKTQLEPVIKYRNDYNSFYKEYGNTRSGLKYNEIFYSCFDKKKKTGTLKINECRYRKFTQDYNNFCLIKEIGHLTYLKTMLPNELIQKSETIVANVKQIDLFMEFLKSLEGKRLYLDDRDYVKKIFKSSVAIKLSGKSIGISTLNGQIEDLYKDIYPYRFFNKDKEGNYYIDKQRVLSNGTENPNRDKTYWLLEDRSCRE